MYTQYESFTSLGRTAATSSSITENKEGMKTGGQRDRREKLVKPEDLKLPGLKQIKPSFPQRPGRDGTAEKATSTADKTLQDRTPTGDKTPTIDTTSPFGSTEENFSFTSGAVSTESRLKHRIYCPSKTTGDVTGDNEMLRHRIYCPTRDIVCMDPRGSGQTEIQLPDPDVKQHQNHTTLSSPTQDSPDKLKIFCKTGPSFTIGGSQTWSPGKEESKSVEKAEYPKLLSVTRECNLPTRFYTRYSYHGCTDVKHVKLQSKVKDSRGFIHNKVCTDLHDDDVCGKTCYSSSLLRKKDRENPLSGRYLTG